MTSSFIAVAGMMGSGKTTLARALGNELGWRILPEGLRSRTYLADLFNDQKRWAFDTQVSFLCEKAIRLKKYLDADVNVVVDRSLYEDVEIFAKYFRDCNSIDNRSYSTYVELSEHFLDGLPAPSLVIFCECNIKEIEHRVRRRKAPADELYPAGHLRQIYSKYITWIGSYRRSPLCKVNSNIYDFRIPRVCKHIAQEVRNLLIRSRYSDIQLTLSGILEESEKPLTEHYVEQLVPVELPLPRTVFRASKGKLLSYPSSYIAAPFTSAASIQIPREAPALISLDAPHGLIPKGRYRDTLNGISRSMVSLGFSVMLPHRDINKWGRKILSPDTVYSMCTDAVKNCDLFVGLLGMSHGSHYEYGIAIGMGKPSIIISTEEMPHSFVADGVNVDSDRCLLVRCTSLASIPRALRERRVVEFLHSFFPLEELR